MEVMGNIFSEHDLRANLQEVKVLVCDQPFVETVLPKREH